MTPAIEVIQIGNAADEKLSVSMKGEAADIIQVLINGLPREALRQIQGALETELGRRRDVASGSAK